MACGDLTGKWLGGQARTVDPPPSVCAGPFADSERIVLAARVIQSGSIPNSRAQLCGVEKLGLDTARMVA